MQSEGPAGQRHRAPGPRVRARREAARADAVQRLARWKRASGAGAVLAFGALVGLIGVAGARGNDHPSGPTPPSVGTQLTRPGGDGSGAEPSTAPDDSYFGSQDGGYGFSDNRSRSDPVGRSSVS
ncbi:MAG TPA: hypothetical protein VGA45_19935 [Actinomycetota bacterium]